MELLLAGGDQKVACHPAIEDHHHGGPDPQASGPNLRSDKAFEEVAVPPNKTKSSGNVVTSRDHTSNPGERFLSVGAGNRMNGVGLRRVGTHPLPERRERRLRVGLGERDDATDCPPEIAAFLLIKAVEHVEVARIHAPGQ